MQAVLQQIVDVHKLPKHNRHIIVKLDCGKLNGTKLSYIEYSCIKMVNNF